MDTNKMRDQVREQFEEKFPVPNGMVWCDAARQYVKALGCICPPAAITAHNQLWKSWQASREAVAVVLPDEEPGYMYYAPDVLAAIEAQGLKVAP